MKNIITAFLCLLILGGCIDQDIPMDVPQITISTQPSQEIEPTIVDTKPTEETLAQTEPTIQTEPNEADLSVTTPQPTNPIETQPLETEPQKTLEELIADGTYVLRRKYDFYKGSVPMSEIQTITFSRIAPAVYDECWHVNMTYTDDIIGYRTGLDVVIAGEHIYANSDCRYMFAAKDKYGDVLWSSLVSVRGLELLNMSTATNMSYMFYGGKFDSLLGIGSWNTSSVYEMKMTFAGCTNLTALDIGTWDVSNVQSFVGMFQGHDNAGDMKLQYLEVSNWDTSSAFSMSHMFYGCGAMTYIPVEDWDVSNVGSFSHMFADCFSLQSIDFSRWDTTSACSFDAFLNDCRSLIVVDVSGLNTSACRQFSQMFEACTNLQSIIGLETWDVSNASDYAFSETFHCCYSLQEVNIGGWSTAPDNTARMFKNCYALTAIDMSGFDMTNNAAVTEMFMGCGNLKEVVGMNAWKLESAKGYDSMYSGTIFDK